MSKKIYVGNMSYTTKEDTLVSLFSPYGNVISATIITDRDTSQSKGFGFVEMDDSADAEKAISTLSGKEVDGRKIRVNYAEEKKPRDRSSDRGGRRPYRNDRPPRKYGDY